MILRKMEKKRNWLQNRYEEAEKQKEARNKYMENFWKNFCELTKKKSISCVFGCGSMSVPGKDLCQECNEKYNEYLNKMSKRD